MTINFTIWINRKFMDENKNSLPEVVNDFISDSSFQKLYDLPDVFDYAAVSPTGTDEMICKNVFDDSQYVGRFVIQLSEGSADFILFDTLKSGIATFEIGENNYRGQPCQSDDYRQRDVHSSKSRSTFRGFRDFPSVPLFLFSDEIFDQQGSQTKESEKSSDIGNCRDEYR